MGSYPISRTKNAPHSWGAFLARLVRFEPGAVVNEAPVGLQSRTLSEPAGECSNPISRTKSFPNSLNV